MDSKNLSADDGPHLPAKDDSSDWQESLAFQFYDPRKRIGGYHHVGLQRTIGRADIWSWLTHEGRTIHNHQDLDARIPQRDFPDFRLGPLGVSATAPLTGRKVVIDDGGTQLSLQYDGFSAPAHFSGSSGSSGNFAKGHYETIGRAVGELKHEGKTIAIDAWAFDDRSWGERDWGKLLTHRFLWACFGSDLYLSMYTVTSPAGPYNFGFLHTGDQHHDIVDVEIDVQVMGNGVFIKSFEAIGWTRDAGGFRLTGRADGNLVITHRQGFMCSPAAFRMEMNGRIGSGILEVNELKKPTPQLIETFGLKTPPQ